MMSSSEGQELREMIQRAFEDLGGRATKGEIVAHLESQIPGFLKSAILRAGLSTKVGAYLRQPGRLGLPKAPEVDKDGTHVQLELMLPDEFRYVVARQMDNSASAYRRAQQMADLCFALHDVRIPIQLAA
jgi:hypothetical protein